jgi:hypothetical protein
MSEPRDPQLREPAWSRFDATGAGVAVAIESDSGWRALAPTLAG